MKILFANARQPYPLFRGGDGITIHDLLTYRFSKGDEIYQLGVSDPYEQAYKVQNTIKLLKNLNVNFEIKDDTIEIFDNSYKKEMISSSRFSTYLEDIVNNFKPDIVLTQLEKSEEVIKLCKKRNLKCIFLLHDHDPMNYQTMNVSETLHHIVFNSYNTQNHFAEYAKCKHSVIYPGIKFEDYKASRINPEYITMINPVKNKGALIIDALIENFPNEKFLLVKGWKTLETKNHNFPNVTVLERNYDMKDIYAKTKILLIPSQWEEAFGRVAPEAAINSIPIIASRVGGLSESVGSGGLLIDEFTNYNVWISQLSLLLSNSGIQDTLGKKGEENSKKFSFDQISKQWDEILT